MAVAVTKPRVVSMAGLYDTFHLKDYDGALSVVPAKNLGGAKLTTGALDASYGDRMGGALDLTTIQPAEQRRTLLGLSSVDALVQGSGALPHDRGSWLASGRRGFLDLAGRAIGSENPALWDLLGKLELRLGESQLLGIRALAAADDLDFEEREDGGFKRLQNDYDDRYAWLRHQGILGGSLLVESGLSWTRITRDRNGTETDDKGSFDVADERRTDVAALSQTWSVAPSAEHLLRWGGQLRDYYAAFDYRNRIEPEFELEGSWTATRDEENAYRGDQRSRHTEIWISDRVALREALTELGPIRPSFAPRPDVVEPRASLAWSLMPASVLRFVGLSAESAALRAPGRGRPRRSCRARPSLVVGALRPAGRGARFARARPSSTTPEALRKRARAAQHPA
jgi:hypothetical protein